ncbi:PQQ-binding-like beta-propeller repeat protein [Streptomyces sp. NPDC049837]|uniref:outer membrane protein assembly factor BamB family protein n=1 Tax=Streptomyces sp. NPDC049837 TaxID=3155277 RepID=UPI00344AC655
MEPSSPLQPIEPLRDGDPHRCGPYTVLARLGESASAVRYLARADDGTTAVVTVAPARLAELPAFRRRFAAEARTAERLAGGWVPRPLAADVDGPRLWTATPYEPALPLGEAVALAGPLPEKAVRVLGAGLAETLSRVHATGAVLHGLAPGTVLLAADGPRLTAFGALGAAGSAEARAGGQLSVRLGYLTPEQLAGHEPGPPSDVFVLGLLLAYAAAGTPPLADAAAIADAEPDLGAVPEDLRPLIAQCLAKSPDDRPTAGRVAATLALEGAAALARGSWLPDRLATAIAAQAARVAALEAPLHGTPGNDTALTDAAADGDAGPADAGVGDAGVGDAGPDGTGSGGVGPADAGAGGVGPDGAGVGDAASAGADSPGAGSPGADLDGRTVRVGRQVRREPPATELVPAARPPQVLLPPAPPVQAQAPAPALPVPLPVRVPAPAPASPSPALSRRGLFTGLAAGVAGAVLGGGGVLAFTSGDGEEPRTDARPAARPRPAVSGVPPQPRWAYVHPATERSTLNAAVWRDRTLVLTSDAHTTGVDLATGRRLWQRADAASGHRALTVGGDRLLVVGADGFRLLSPKDGTVEGRTPFPGGLRLSAVAGHAGDVVWFTGTVAARTYLFAYDVARSKELWRVQVPNGRPPYTPAYEVLALRPDALVVRQDPRSLTAAQVKAAKGLAIFYAHDRATGARQWFRPFGGARPGATVSGDESGRLYTAVGNALHGFDTRTRRPLWQLAGGGVFGRAEVRGGTLYVADRSQAVYAVDPATGRARWRRGTEAAAGGDVPGVTVSASGRTLLAADGSQVTAFGAGDGRRLWKFQDAGVQDPGGKETSAPYTALAAGAAGVVVRRDRTFYALPVE